MKRIIAVILIISLFLSGCEYSTEPDEKSFVTAIGVDKGTEYRLRFTFVFTSPSPREDDVKSVKQDEIVVIEAPSVYSAIEQMTGFMSKEIELAHTQTIIFSEELAKEGIEDFVYMLVRSDNFRPNTYVCVADKTSMEFLEKVNPVQVNHLEKYFQLLFSNLSTSTYGDMYLYDTYFELIGDSKTSVLPLCAINEEQIETSSETSSGPQQGSSGGGGGGEGGGSGESGGEKPSEAPTEAPSSEKGAETDDFLINTIAGETVRKGKNPAEVMGVAVIKDGKFIGQLGRIETLLSQMVTNSMPGTYLTLSHPNAPTQKINIYLSQDSVTKINVDVTDDPKISVKVSLSGDFTSMGTDNTPIKNPKEFEEGLEKKIEEELLKLLEKSRDEFDGDICSFFDKARGKFSTVREWEAYNWEERYSKAQFDVDVKVTMRGYGELSKDT